MSISTSLIMSAMAAISASFIPRVVTAGVPGLGAIPGWLHSPQTDPPATTTTAP